VGHAVGTDDSARKRIRELEQLFGGHRCLEARW